MNDPKTTVFVVDDDASILRAMQRLISAEGLSVVPFASPREFLEQHDSTAHACVVLDVAMPGLSGIQLQQSLADRGSELPIIFLTGCGDIPMSVGAMKSGAADFLTKPVDETKLLAAIRAALSRASFARDAQAEVSEIRSRLARLTPREYEVLQHVVSGRLNKETAAELGIVEKTIKVHRARVMEKMNANSLAELVRVAERAGISGFITDDVNAACWTKVQ